MQILMCDNAVVQDNDNCIFFKMMKPLFRIAQWL